MTQTNTLGIKISAAPEGEWLCLTTAERRLIELTRVLHKHKKHCMIVVRFDGLAWQVYHTSPPIRVEET